MIKNTANWQETGALDYPPDGFIYLQSNETIFKIGEDDLQEAESTHAMTLFEYCMHLPGRQPRQHLLAVHIYRNMVTLIGMDRVAATVSIPFDYAKEPHKLLTFFYRLATSDRESLGYGPSMVPASQDEILSLHESLPNFDNPEQLIRDDKLIYEAFSDAIIHKTSSIWPIYKVTVTDPDGSKHDFLVSKPCTDLPSLYGRGGKGYIAFDLSRKDFVFLKDQWRPETRNMAPEYAVYERMKNRGLTVEDYVATMRCGGDVPRSDKRGDVPGSDKPGGQRTRSQTRLQQPTLARIHCRLVLNEIAHHLSNYTNTRGRVTVVLCALWGMSDRLTSPLSSC